MWPFDIPAKRRAAEQKQREEYHAEMQRQQRDRIEAAKREWNSKNRVSSAAPQSSSPSVSNDMLNPMSLSSPLNPIYNTSYSAPSHDSHSSSRCNSSDSSSYSSSYDSSSSSSDCGSSSSSSSFD